MIRAKYDPYGALQSKGKDTSIKGDSNEHRVVAALLERKFNASLVDFKNSKYDIVVEVSDASFLRIQVKTADSGRVSFTGGGRGAIHDPNITTYRYTPENCDCLVGVVVERNNGGDTIDFYFVPTLWSRTVNQDSISIKKIPQAKNNFEILNRCKDMDYVNELFDGVIVKQ